MSDQHVNLICRLVTFFVVVFAVFVVQAALGYIFESTESRYARLYDRKKRLDKKYWSAQLAWLNEHK